MAASGVNISAVPGQTSAPNTPSHIAERANGAAQSRKRSRSGSRRPSQPASSSDATKLSPAAQQERLLKQYVARDQVHGAAINDQENKSRWFMEAKVEKVKHYKDEVRALRQTNPGAVYGYGYAGYGNGRTDDKPRLVFPAQRKRMGGRRTKELHVSRKDMAQQADQLEELVPVRLDIEFEKIKLRDTFTWNLHDRVVPSELFAENLVEDFRLPPESSHQLVRQVHQEIQEQIQDFYPHVFIDEEALDPHLPYHAYKNDEMRILIKLNITIGQITLVDQFEWDVNNPLNSPDEFARSMARDLSLSGEFTTAIAHDIREQTQLFTRSLYITGHPFDGRPVEDPDLREGFLPSPLPSVFRPVQSAKDYTPYLYELNEADMEKTELSMLREQRRQKRSVNRRGGPALPDLKDRQRTVRSLVVSSVLPGAAESVEGSRIYKYTRAATGRGRRSGARGDGGDDSDESESEDSGPDSPQIISQLLQQGTARTRGMRGAATAAQAAMRLNLGRSATPETSSLHHHETRTSARRVGGGFDTREESVLEPTSLIVKLRIAPKKYRQWMQNRKARRSGEYQQPGYASTPLMASQTFTRQPTSTPARGSMPPPPTTPGMPPRTLSGLRGRSTDAATPQPLPSGVGGQQQRYNYSIDGRVDSTYPQPSEPPPPPPQWLNQAIAILHERYPHDNFEAMMRHSAVDRNTQQPVRMDTLQAGQAPPPHVKWQYLPRIRCNDCPGKLYTAVPSSAVEGFEIHLKNRHHKERVGILQQRAFGFWG
ncbi:hypothetical protein B0A49_08821 [Cryomyces minteri]|uniref:SWI/SNF chromatin-remodeling complex subunit snf5 n=1 Tax=Cryomyces minteri TaxID=331657 RepID=A0A4U0WNX8_9PEZI|nr:hypothetical protein B0A49_08821 [Cryomyces minteri]